LETAAHHPYAGEDQAAETDDRPRVDCERFERSHQRGRAGEVHRALCMSRARERESEKGGSHHASCVRDGLL
jgi:hypothetical protein